MGPNAGTCSMDYTTTFLSYSFEQTVYTICRWSPWCQTDILAPAILFVSSKLMDAWQLKDTGHLYTSGCSFKSKPHPNAEAALSSFLNGAAFKTRRDQLAP